MANPLSATAVAAVTAWEEGYSPRDHIIIIFIHRSRERAAGEGRPEFGGGVPSESWLIFLGSWDFVRPLLFFTSICFFLSPSLFLFPISPKATLYCARDMSVLC